jgi:hypothetical protein
MIVPKTSMPKPFLLSQIKSEPLDQQCLEDQSTNLNNELPVQNDLLSIISSIKPIMVKAEPIINERFQYLEKLLFDDGLDSVLAHGGLIQIYHYFKEIISLKEPHRELTLLLKVLAKANLTVDMLKETKIGKLVNLVRLEQRFDREVRV